MNSCATRFKAVIRLASFLLIALPFCRAASAYNLIHGFAGEPNDGAGPQGSLATDGTVLYGFTLNGGATNNTGTIFKVNTNGSGYQVLHSFVGLSFFQILLGQTGNTNDGVNPYGTPLVMGSTIYGLTISGGTNGLGTIFQINTDGTGFQLLHHFGSGIDGQQPYGSLVTDGTNLFGMTSGGGFDSEGTIFVIGTNGTGYRILHNFATGGIDGLAPRGSLVYSNGVLYGMTQMGGPANVGTIFCLNADGTGYKIIHDFGSFINDGVNPYGSLIISASTLYGMSSAGGSNNHGAVFSVQTDGSSFQVLHSFSTSELSLFDGGGDLTLSNSTLYGMANTGGTNGLGFGGVFQVNTDGSGYEFVHIFNFSFNNLTDGSTPDGSLLLLGSQLYGMTFAGGSSHNAGAVFSLAPGSGGGGGGGGAIGGLKVNLLPAAAVNAGAEWQADAGAFFQSGVVVTSLPAGPHFITFKAAAGFNTPPAQIANVTLGTTNTITATYTSTSVDTTKPTLKIITPTARQLTSNSVFTATGTATDNIGVAGVHYRLNGGAWTTATTADNWANWSTPGLSLTPGSNIFSAYALDTSANASATNTVSFTFVVTAPLVVNINGAGSIKPSLNGTQQPIGKLLSMTAKAAKGSAFVNWTGSFVTNSSKLTFVMESNLEFTANFKDIARPVNVVLSPTKNQIVTNPAPVARGAAKDNVGVAAVWFQVDGGGWTAANLPDGTNWTTPDLAPMLLSGPGTIQAFAQDAAGNSSLTNTVLFTYRVEPGADWAPDSLNGLVAAVTPTAAPPESVGFDLSTFARTGATNDTEAEDFAAGTYTYEKADTNVAQLSLSFTNPPSNSNNFGPVSLVFTNHYGGYFTNADDGSTGGFNASIATAFVPPTVAGKTITATSSKNGKVTSIKLGTTTFIKTPANNSNTGSSSGNYTFTRYSPVCGMFAFAFTDVVDAGETAYVQATFTSATGGTYFVTIFDNLGVLQDTDEGTLTLK